MRHWVLLGLAISVIRSERRSSLRLVGGLVSLDVESGLVVVLVLATGAEKTLIS
jgi:hypothetical protein